MGNITAANAVYTLAIANVFPVPQRLQGFSADDIFSTDPVESGELLMGVDGILSAGFIYKEVKQTIMLQGDSASSVIFDAWYNAERLAVQKFAASGIITLTGIGRTWALTQGYLMQYAPIPDAKKVLQPRRFGITWQVIQAAPSS